MVDIVALQAANEKRWKAAKATHNFTNEAKALVAAKARYQAVEAKTRVPWAIIAVIHMRESSQNWGRSLAQGDRWDRVSVNVPAGRGPFKSWGEAAIDALVNCHPFLSKKQWRTIGETLTNLEQYNGLGPAMRGKSSGYIWAGTDQYHGGKFIRDGVWDANAFDSQPGCARLLQQMMELDPSIKLTSGAVVTPKAAATTSVVVATASTAATAVHQGWGATQWLAAACVLGVVVLIAYLMLRKKD